MYQLPSVVTEELNFFKTNEFIKINIFDDIDYNINLIQDILSEKERLIIVSLSESFANIPLYNRIVNLIESSNKDIRISCSTASQFKFSTHPLTNLIMWKDVVGRDDVHWWSKNNYTFPSYFKIDNTISDVGRNLKSIISVRKKNKLRKYLFDRIDETNIDGIYRYYNWCDSIQMEDTQLSKTPIRTIDELHKDYQNCFISFVVETEIGNSSDNFTSTFTEKTLFSLVNGTMPIILGSKNLIRDLDNLGITTFNKHFGFDYLVDSYDSHSTNRIDVFIECINRVKKADLSTIKNLWETNKDNLQKNYDIVASILFNKKYNNYFYDEYYNSQKLSNTHLIHI